MYLSEMQVGFTNPTIILKKYIIILKLSNLLNIHLQKISFCETIKNSKNCHVAVFTVFCIFKN